MSANDLPDTVDRSGADSVDTVDPSVSDSRDAAERQALLGGDETFSAHLLAHLYAVMALVIGVVATFGAVFVAIGIGILTRLPVIRRRIVHGASRTEA